MSDLISREALRKAIGDEFDLEVCNGNIMLMSKMGIVSKVLAYIDNAPTVDIKDQIAGAYNEGYACGSRENKRPQGEWIRTALYGQTCLECNQCGKSDFYMKYDNFCPNCGAKMKGGDSE